MRNMVAIASAAVLGYSGCGFIEPSSCKVGDEAARAGRFADAVSLLTKCLESDLLPGAVRRTALEARAWAYANSGDPRRAVADQEEMFRLGPPSQYGELINFAGYLRSVGRFDDSLAAIRGAEKLGTSEPSMMTQYNLGWTLSELGRDKEAIAAFSKGMPVQPDYVYAYWRRGLAYERQGKRSEAKADFRTVSELIDRTPLEGESKKFLSEMNAKFTEYGVSTHAGK